MFAPAVLVIGVGGCSAMGPPAFSYASQERGNKVCASLFSTPELMQLSTKTPVLPGQLPSPDMLQINEVPSEIEVQAIGALESATRNCAQMRAGAGVPTSASEDILQARISRLRHALYTGTIPYAVYNYGLAQALKKHTKFMVQGEQAYSDGKAAGDGQMFGLALRDLMVAPIPNSGWSCSTASTASSPSVTCQ